MPRDQGNGTVGLEDPYDDSLDLTSGKCYISRSNSPVSDEPRGFPIAVDRPISGLEAPTKLVIYQEEEEPQNTSPDGAVYFRPRVRVSPEYEKPYVDEIEFSGDDTEPSTPCTPARIVRIRSIDTSSPIESVKHAVSRFGGTVDWKAQKSRSFERRKQLDKELERTQEEIPVIRQQTEAAEEAKTQVFDDLEATNQLIEELKVNLEKAETEEHKARQDYEEASLKVNETEQGSANEARVAANEQREEARYRHEAALFELRCVKEELEAMQKEYTSLLNEKEAAAKRAEEALCASKEAEKAAEELSKELVSTKELLELACAEHQEAEEERLGASMAADQDTLGWEKEMKEAEEDIAELKRQIEAEKDLKGKLNAASALLVNLKSELAAYLESKMECVADEDPASEDQNRSKMQAEVVRAKGELEEMKITTEKAIAEVNCLKVAATSLKMELEQENAELAILKQREGMATVAVASLEAELEKMKAEISAVQTREKEAKEKTAELPKQLQVASQEADEAKSGAGAAREALRKAKDEAEQAKAGASTVESRLFAARKEIEAAKASEKLAMDSIRALQESESAQINDRGDTPDRVTLPIEEYYELSKQAQEAEERANTKVAAALTQIEAAKEAEAQTLSKLEETNREISTRKEVFKAASDKAERANEAKLNVEQELRKWRAENEQRRKGDSAVNSPRKGAEGHDNKGLGKAADTPAHTSHEHGHEVKSTENDVAPLRIASSLMGSGRSETSSPGKVDHSSSVESSPDGKGGKKKKKSILPKIFMIFNKKKHPSKT